MPEIHEVDRKIRELSEQHQRLLRSLKGRGWTRISEIRKFWDQLEAIEIELKALGAQWEALQGLDLEVLHA